MIKQLTIQKCTCGQNGCATYGFKEGLFQWGTGFSLKEAKEIAKRYNTYKKPKIKGKKK